MFLLKNYRSTFSLLLFLFTSTATLACDSPTETLACDGENRHVEMISLQKSTFLERDADFNQYVQQQVATINSIAKELNLENFEISSRDLSMSRSTQMTDQFEVYFSVSVSFSPNEKALSAFVQSMNINSASQYIYDEGCE